MGKPQHRNFKHHIKNSSQGPIRLYHGLIYSQARLSMVLEVFRISNLSSLQNLKCENIMLSATSLWVSFFTAVPWTIWFKDNQWIIAIPKKFWTSPFFLIRFCPFLYQILYAKHRLSHRRKRRHCHQSYHRFGQRHHYDHPICLLPSLANHCVSSLYCHSASHQCLNPLLTAAKKTQLD